MLKLTDITAKTTIVDNDTEQTLSIIQTKWTGSVLTIYFTDSSGNLNQKLLTPADETKYSIAVDSLPFTFTANADEFKLVSEAQRIKFAHLYDPYLAIHNSLVEPLPHQIDAVYGTMLTRQPLRFLLADDPGAGKTIMTGLYIRELIIRGDLQRCLIVTPGSLSEQWKEELYKKFGLDFEIISSSRIESDTNVFHKVPLCIARLDILRREEYKTLISNTEWDLIVCDEAHKMSASVSGTKVEYTKRYHLGEELSKITRHFLLLTATPHTGIEASFQIFMALLDADRFADVSALKHITQDYSDLYRRVVKEEMKKFDGTPLFPERITETVEYDLSPDEYELYEAVTKYVTDEFNRADKLESGRKNNIGFALTTLQRRLASSPLAILLSLKRRRDRLNKKLSEANFFETEYEKPYFDEEDYDDDFNADEMEEAEEVFVSKVTAAQTSDELRAEIAILDKLVEMAEYVYSAGTDTKYLQLISLFYDNEYMVSHDGQRRKIIVFTEHRDTLEYLVDKLREVLRNDYNVEYIHGGMKRDDRRAVEDRFRNLSEVYVLVATDAAGEGINLQRAHLMINYDMPWNPNRLEQRFGRIHRIGQTEVCRLWNLIAHQTREGAVFLRLLNKVEQIRTALSGKVYDILGQVKYQNKPLRDLLIAAIRYATNQQKIVEYSDIIDEALNSEETKKLLTDEALESSLFDIYQIKSDMEQQAADKLQPHFIANFFNAAMNHLNDNCIRTRKPEPGIFEVKRVPNAIRNRDIRHIQPAYERVCFDKKLARSNVEHITPEHPLLKSLIDDICSKYTPLLQQGTIFIDHTDTNDAIRLLFYIEDTIRNDTHVLSQQIYFVEMLSDKSTQNVGAATYLSYKTPTEAQQKQIIAYIEKQDWLSRDLSQTVMQFAIENISLSHLREVKEKKLKHLKKIQTATEKRLQTLIDYYEKLHYELLEREKTHKPNPKKNASDAKIKSDEFYYRLQQKRREMERERNIYPIEPRILSAAIIVPYQLLMNICDISDNSYTIDMLAKKQVEQIAMAAVIDYEISLGYIPTDVSSQNLGYDIHSKLPPDKHTGSTTINRHIEVKGRSIGADSITMTKNEIIKAKNLLQTYILAIVFVDGTNTQIHYVVNPLDPTAELIPISQNYLIADLLKKNKGGIG
jgi:SNF2 family DNA or RNA helicase